MATVLMELFAREQNSMFHILEKEKEAGLMSVVWHSMQAQRSKYWKYEKFADLVSQIGRQFGLESSKLFIIYSVHNLDESSLV